MRPTNIETGGGIIALHELDFYFAHAASLPGWGCSAESESAADEAARPRLHHGLHCEDGNRRSGLESCGHDQRGQWRPLAVVYSDDWPGRPIHVSKPRTRAIPPF